MKVRAIAGGVAIMRVDGNRSPHGSLIWKMAHENPEPTEIVDRRAGTPIGEIVRGLARDDDRDHGAPLSKARLASSSVRNVPMVVPVVSIAMKVPPITSITPSAVAPSVT
jgi:hypothetical protein